MFLHYFLSGLLYRFTVSIHNNLCFYITFYQDYCIDSQQFMFLHYFLSGLLYRFTTTYVSTFLFIRITVSIHNNLCFYITFYLDYCIDSQQLMFLHYFLSGLLYRFTTIDVSTFLLSGLLYRFTTTYVSTFLFYQDYCSDSQQLMFLHFFLSGLLYRFTTIYVSTLLFIRITVSIHNNLCFYITFYQDYCIDSQQFMFLHYFLSGLLYRFNMFLQLFIRITVSIHNNMFLHFLSGLL